MNESEKERLIKKDIESIENRVRHAFNQGYEMGLKASSSEIPNTCGDAISRQAVLNLMRGLTRWCVKSEDGKWKNVGLLYDDVMFGIDRLPSVNPQQRTGRWVKEGQGGRYKWMCSNCGTHHRALYDYCPSCGCKMEVKE